MSLHHHIPRVCGDPGACCSGPECWWDSSHVSCTWSRLCQDVAPIWGWSHPFAPKAVAVGNALGKLRLAQRSESQDHSLIFPSPKTSTWVKPHQVRCFLVVVRQNDGHRMSGTMPSCWKAVCNASPCPASRACNTWTTLWMKRPTCPSACRSSLKRQNLMYPLPVNWDEVVCMQCLMARRSKGWFYGQFRMMPWNIWSLSLPIAMMRGWAMPCPLCWAVPCTASWAVPCWLMASMVLFQGR